MPAGWLGAAELARAVERVGDVAAVTPVIDIEGPACAFSAKLESLQVTGSFKVRGAANKLLGSAGDPQGVVACSTGNHGRAVAHVARRLGRPAWIYVPDDVDPVKLAAIRAEGATAVLAGASYDEAARRAEEVAGQQGLLFVHPFDDPAVIAGQATVGVELCAQVPDATSVLVPLSGGGLAAGVGTALRLLRPETRLVGVSARNASVLHQSLQRGEPSLVDEEPTVAGALAGGLGPANRWSFRICADVLDGTVLVSEEQIQRAMRLFRDRHLVVEGGGATAAAALLEPGDGLLELIGARPVVVVTGGNIDLAAWGRAVA